MKPIAARFMRKTISQVILILIALGILLAIMGSIGVLGLLRIAETNERAVDALSVTSRNTPEHVAVSNGTRGAVDASRSDWGAGGQSDASPQAVADQPDTVVQGPPLVPNIPPPPPPLVPINPADPIVDSSKVPVAFARPIVLEAAVARLHGGAVCHLGDSHDIASWTRSDEWIDWSIQTPLKHDQPYYVELTYSCGPGFGGDFAISVGDGNTVGHARSTGSWKNFKTERLGVIQLPSGSSTLSIKPMFGMRRNLMQLRRIELIPADSQADADTTPAPSKEKRRAGAIDDVILFDITANTPVHSITDGTIIDLAFLPHRDLTVLAAVSGNPGSVRFEVDGGTSTRVENQAPFVLAGHDPHDPNRICPWGLSMGEHTLTVTPFTGADGTGYAGNSLTVHLKIGWLVEAVSH